MDGLLGKKLRKLWCSAYMSKFCETSRLGSLAAQWINHGPWVFGEASRKRPRSVVAITAKTLLSREKNTTHGARKEVAKELIADIKTKCIRNCMYSVYIGYSRILFAPCSSMPQSRLLSKRPLPLRMPLSVFTSSPPRPRSQPPSDPWRLFALPLLLRFQGGGYPCPWPSSPSLLVGGRPWWQSPAILLTIGTLPGWGPAARLVISWRPPWEFVVTAIEMVSNCTDYKNRQWKSFDSYVPRHFCNLRASVWCCCKPMAPDHLSRGRRQTLAFHAELLPAAKRIRQRPGCHSPQQPWGWQRPCGSSWRRHRGHPRGRFCCLFIAYQHQVVWTRVAHPRGPLTFVTGAHLGALEAGNHGVHQVASLQYIY